MKAPKLFFVEQGLAELGLSDMVYDYAPEDIERVCVRLDGALAELETKGARVSGWIYGAVPGASNAESMVTIPNGLVNLVILTAAIVSAPSIGKNLSNVTLAQLNVARDNLLYFRKTIPQMQRNPNTPIGSGNQINADSTQFYPMQPCQLDAGPDESFSPEFDLFSGDTGYGNP